MDRDVLKRLESMFAAATGDVRRLDDVIRFSSIPVVVHELVSTHQYWVGLYAALIHSTIRPDDKLLLGRIMVRAATHDLVEGWTGDFVRTFKYSSEELRSAISKAEDKLLATLPPELQELCADEHDDEHDYVEAVVKAADFMALHQYMVRELMRGNKSIRPFYTRMTRDLYDQQTRFYKHPSLVALFKLMAESASEIATREA